MLSKNQLGFLYMFLSIIGFSLMDVIVKWSVDYPIGQILFFRGFCALLHLKKKRNLDFVTVTLLKTDFGPKKTEK